jgi:ArsR family transcriptional regulator, nickel/cobalt-responsive transcriptional repressor
MYAVLRMPKSHVHADYRLREPIDEAVGDAIAQTMQALATPSRVRLLYALRDGEQSVSELALASQLAPAATSQQLRILRHLKLVVARREGQVMRYRLHDDHVGVLLDEIRNHVEHAIHDWSSPAESPAAEGKDRGSRRSRSSDAARG